ncbi:hypothetical protein RRG08_023451 [Elysia crispata]|uniref:BESS domain-containing protein n=1 Tax=Elysia crispata TaxID=231223 RepID=A0AAE1DXL0_9GAST|nr:hypothetical protein RRG08_023451 [Elysia crispata]
MAASLRRCPSRMKGLITRSWMSVVMVSTPAPCVMISSSLHSVLCKTMAAFTAQSTFSEYHIWVREHQIGHEWETFISYYYMRTRPTISYLAEVPDEDPLQPHNVTDEEDDASQISDFQPLQDRTITPLNTSIASSIQSTSKRKQKRTLDVLDVALCQYLKKSRTPEKREEKQDDVDLFLQKMAATIRKLPARTLADVKLKIRVAFGVLYLGQ